jgi:response regulator RpfG family c-di-GMP phosphodiesterase
VCVTRLVLFYKQTLMIKSFIKKYKNVSESKKKIIKKEGGMNEEKELIIVPRGDAIVFLIDDADMNRLILKRFIESFKRDNDVDLKIKEFPNGLEFVNFLKENSFILDKTVIFLDIVMPFMNGFEVLEFLETYSNKKKCDVYMLSGLVDSENVKKMNKYDIKSFISKPINKSLFFEILKYDTKSN